MKEFDFGWGDDFFSSNLMFDDEHKEEKKKRPKGKIIAVLIILVLGYFVFRSGVNLHSILGHFSSGEGKSDIGVNNSGNDSVGWDNEVLNYRGYYANQYIVKLEFLDSVIINDENYYKLVLKIKNGGLAQSLNIISPTKELVFYDSNSGNKSGKLTVNVMNSGGKLSVLFRPLVPFSREYVPVIIYSNDESAYDYLLIKTSIEKNNPIPPLIRSNVKISVNQITPASIVDKNVVLAKFNIVAFTGASSYAYGTLVEIELADDVYKFVKSDSSMIIAPTLTPDYTLNLYIRKDTGEFLAGERIKAVVTLRTADGLLTQKMTTIIVKG